MVFNFEMYKKSDIFIQTLLSEYGGAREHDGFLNMLHMFVNDFGDILAPMEYVESENFVAKYDTESLRCCIRTDGKSGFVFISHYQRHTEFEDIEGAIIDTGYVRFPAINVKGQTAFFLPFNMDLMGNLLEYATVQPLCKVDDTYFFVALNGISPEYKFADGRLYKPLASHNYAFEKNGVKIVTLTYDEAKYARKLSGKLYIGGRTNIYEDEGRILSMEDGSCSCYRWNGNGFDKTEVSIEFENANQR